jgi:hypothetical protein
MTMKSSIPSTLPLSSIKKDPQNVHISAHKTKHSLSSPAIESCISPKHMPAKTQTKIQFVAQTPKRVSYSCVPTGYEKHYEEPKGIPIPSPSQSWNCSDEAQSALNTLIQVADKLPAPIHNLKDNITDYSKPYSSCWSAARDIRIADAEAKIEKYRMQCANPFHKASKPGLPYYTALPIKKKEVKLCPERLPTNYNCKLWQDLEKQCGKAKANKIWNNQVNRLEKKKAVYHWLKKGDMETRYQKRQELAEKYGMRLEDVVLEEMEKVVESTCPQNQEKNSSLVPSVQHDEDNDFDATLSPEDELTSDSDSYSSDSNDGDSDSEPYEDGLYIRKLRILHIRSSDSKEESSQEGIYAKTLKGAIHREEKPFVNNSCIGETKDSGYRSFNPQI